MADAVAWTSLAISIIVAIYTGVFQLLSYRRQHLPKLTVFARGVTDIRAADPGDVDGLTTNLGGVVMEPALAVSVVNTGSRPVEISEVHTVREGDDGGYWLREAQGRITLRLEPAQSHHWLEPMTTHFLKLTSREPGEEGIRMKAQVTLADGRKFSSEYVDMWLPGAKGMFKDGKLQRIKRKTRPE